MLVGAQAWTQSQPSVNAEELRGVVGFGLMVYKEAVISLLSSIVDVWKQALPHDSRMAVMIEAH